MSNFKFSRSKKPDEPANTTTTAASLEATSSASTSAPAAATATASAPVAGSASAKDFLHHLSILSSAVRRLAADERSYVSELTTQQKCLLSVQCASGSSTGDITRARAFVEETENALADIRGRLKAGITKLNGVLEELEIKFSQHDKNEMKSNEIYEKAQKIWQDNKRFIQEENGIINDNDNDEKNLAQNQFSTKDENDEGALSAASILPAHSTSNIVSVFGGSACLPGDSLYSLSVSVGAALATASFAILNGGYGGTMEAVAKGARQAVSNAVVEGVVVPSLFEARFGAVPNPFNSHILSAPSLAERIHFLTHRSSFFVVLPGQLGTLAELCTAWNQAQLDTVINDARPIFAWRKPWEKVVQLLAQELTLKEGVVKTITFVDDVEDLMKKIKEAGISAKKV